MLKVDIIEKLYITDKKLFPEFLTFLKRKKQDILILDSNEKLRKKFPFQFPLSYIKNQTHS